MVEGDCIILFMELTLYYFLKNHNTKSEIYKEDISNFPELREIIDLCVCVWYVQ